MQPHRSRTDGTSTRPETRVFSLNPLRDSAFSGRCDQDPASTAQAPLTADIPSTSATLRSSSPQDAPSFSAIPSISTEAKPWSGSPRKRGFSDVGGADGRSRVRARVGPGVDADGREEEMEEGEIREVVEDGQSAIVEGDQTSDQNVDQHAQKVKKEDGQQSYDKQKRKQPEEIKAPCPDHEEHEDVKQKNVGDEDGGERVSVTVRHSPSDRVVSCALDKDDLVESLITEAADKLGVESEIHRLMMRYKYVDDNDTVVYYFMECPREETTTVAGIVEGRQLELIDLSHAVDE